MLLDTSSGEFCIRDRRKQFHRGVSDKQHLRRAESQFDVDEHSENLDSSDSISGEQAASTEYSRVPYSPREEEEDEEQLEISSSTEQRVVWGDAASTRSFSCEQRVTNNKNNEAEKMVDRLEKTLPALPRVPGSRTTAAESEDVSTESVEPDSDQ
ncbi:hypothetical protein F2P81_017628 [Scophthalmus maximus]|uniref:Uncharacterized protein n=1 Tax=Scophthalmus maximus TaxID=52904 RepID=A0A6A4SCG4_SCOMX|nr:hypothetical protein F2P81_017628 [Scophthalmus maximus]